MTDNYSQLKDAMKNQKTSLVEVMKTQESVKYLTQANGDGNAAPRNPQSLPHSRNQSPDREIKLNTTQKNVNILFGKKP